MSVAIDRLESLLESVPPRLVTISAAEAARHPAVGKWSRKQILGHLIDSAGNNHQRFVRAQLAPSLEIDTYQQESWVLCQSYQTEPWPDLVNLWLLFNRHLLHVIRVMPEEALSHPVGIGGRPPVSLSDVIADYVSHMEHHLEQIFSSQAAAPPR